MGHEAEHAALRDACVQLKALNNKGIRVDDENGMKTWVEEKCRGGTCGIEPVASIWRYSGGDAHGKEGFKGCSDGRAIAASWGPGVKNPAEYQKALDEVLATMAPPLNLGFALKDLGDFNKPLTHEEKERYGIPKAMNDDTPGATVMSATWNLLEGKNRDGVPYLPEKPASDSRRRSICIRRTSRRWRGASRRPR